MSTKHECYSCDSPKSLEMGFVHYDINLNKSFIKKIKISKIKDVGDYGDFFESAYDLAKVKSSVLVNKLQYEFEKIKSGF